MKRRNDQPHTQGKLRAPSRVITGSAAAAPSQLGRPQPQLLPVASTFASTTTSAAHSTDHEMSEERTSQTQINIDVDVDIIEKFKMKQRMKKSREEKEKREEEDVAQHSSVIGTAAAGNSNESAQGRNRTTHASRSCHIDWLCKDEVHTIMHFLMIDELFKLAGSQRRFYTAASTPVAWRHALAFPLVFDPYDEYQADWIRSSLLIHSMTGGIEIQWNTCDHHDVRDILQEEIDLLLAIPNIREIWIDGTYLRQEQWDYLLSHHSFSALRSIRLEPDDVFPENLASMSRLTSLTHLCIERGGDGISCWCLEGVHLLPHLTSLTIQADTYNSSSCTTSIQKCQHLKRLDIGQPQFHTGRQFHEFLTSPYLRHLESLTIRWIPLIDLDLSTFVATFCAMNQLREFEFPLYAQSHTRTRTMLSVYACENLLRAVVFAPQLRTLRLRLDYDKHSQKIPPSHQVMTELLRTNPKMQIELIDAQLEGQPKVTLFNATNIKLSNDGSSSR